MTEFKLPTINGYQAIAVCEVPKREGIRKGRAIIVDRGEDYKGKDRYVSAFHYENDAEWHHGYYTNSLLKALDDFSRRVTLAAPTERKEATS